MGFREQNRPIEDGATEVEGYLRSTRADAPARATMSADAARDADATAAAPDARNLPIDIRARPQPKAFKPNWRKVARNLVVGPGASAAATGAYKLVRAETMKRLRQNDWRTIAVTSPSRASGASLTALNLAISIAQDFGQTVVLVDLDLTNPSLHRTLGFERRMGAADYLLGDASLSQIVLDVGVERLTVIPSGSPVVGSSELLSSPRMAQMLDEIDRGFGRPIVLFDLPSVLAVDDAMAFAPLADCALLVVEEGETRIDDVRRALRRLEPTKIVGIVLNRSVRGENEIGVISR